MARTELPNGVILPAEYSDDWYEDMTSNLTKLDDVIGSDSEKLNSNDVAFLRMSSAALTDGGTGNFSDLNSSNKLKTGDYVLDSGRKLYQVVSVDSTNETFTVGNSLFKITAESDLAPVAESGDYDDLDNKPDLNPYDQHIVNTDIHVTTADKNKWNNQTYVFRYSGTAITDNSTIAYSTLDSTDNIKSSDKIIDSDGKIFSIVSVDSANETVTVGSALIDLALDANVMHLSGDETASGIKSFIGTRTEFKRSNNDGVILIDNGSFVKGQASNINLGREYHGSSTAVGSCISFFGTSLTDNGNVSQVTLSAINNTPDSTLRTEVNIKYDKSDLRPRKIELGGDVYPASDASYNCGLADKKYLSFNGLNPGALSFPDLSAGLDISGYITTGSSTNDSYTALADGYISIIFSSSTSCGCYVYNYADGIFQRSNSIIDSTYSNVCGVFLPIMKNQTLNIASRATDNIVSAKFFPCLGNV